MVRCLGTILPEDQSAGWKIWAGNNLNQFINRNCAIFHIGKAGVDDLAQIMRRNIGRHANRNTPRPVDEQIGKARRQNLRLAFAGIIIWREIDCILIEIIKQRVGNLG